MSCFLSSEKEFVDLILQCVEKCRSSMDKLCLTEKKTVDMVLNA